MASQKTENDRCLYNAWRICHPMFWWHIEILSLEAATTLCNFFIQLLCERNVFSVIMVYVECAMPNVYLWWYCTQLWVIQSLWAMQKRF